MKNEFDTILQYKEALASGKFQLHEAIREEMENVTDYNKTLNAFITTFDEASAFKISKVPELNNEQLASLPLYSVPLTVKDNIFISGFRSTAGSRAFEDFAPAVNADIVDTAVAAGCVPLGKTNLHELAMGATSTSSFFGPVKNPVDPSRISGGSSGRSAVSVAKSKLPIVSLGTDTGGSVRIPAALCGVCGFKPTFGVLSVAGVFPLSATLDHVGILTKNMLDMRVAFEAFTGPTNFLPTSSRPATSAVKIGIPGSYFFENCVPDVEKAFFRTIDSMRESGFQIVEDLEIKGFERISRTRKTVHLAEAFWFYQDLVKDPKKRELVASDVLSFFDSGSKTTMMEFLISSSERISLISSFSEALSRVDFIAMPTCLTTAPKLDDILGQEAGSIRNQLVRNTEPFNLCGLPSLSIPSHKLGSSDLPTAIEISGKAFDDNYLLEVGQRIWDSLHSPGIN